MIDSLCILLVDDSLFFLSLERQFLGKTPARVIETRSGTEAFELCREHRPTLVYMAYDLPGESGAELCRRIKADPELAETAVILICDSDDERQAEICRDAGCDDLLTRPLDRLGFLESGRRFMVGIREPRQPCLFRVSYTFDGITLHGRCLDLSSGGLFLESSEMLEQGAPLDLEFVLPDRHGLKVRCRAEVAWVNTRNAPLKPSHPVGYGIRFIGLPATSVKALQNFLESRRGG